MAGFWSSLFAILIALAVVLGCHNERRKRRDTTAFNEDLADFFASCQPLKEETGCIFQSLQSPVDYVLRESNWFQDIGNNACACGSGNDTAECWKSALDFLFKERSILHNPTAKCIGKWSHGKGFSKRSPRSTAGVCIAPQGLTMQEMNFTSCVNSNIQASKERYPSIRRLNGTSISVLLRDHFIFCRTFPKFFSNQRRSGSRFNSACGPASPKNLKQMFRVATRENGPLRKTIDLCDPDANQRETTSITDSPSSSAPDSCKRNYGGCDRRNGICWSTGEDTHFCTCKAGFKQDSRWKIHRCIDIDECEEENVCDENARCYNTYGSYKCNCKCGYVMDYTGEHCLDASKISDMCLVPSRCYFYHSFMRSELKPVSFNTVYARNYMPDYSSVDVDFKPYDSRRKDCRCEKGYEFNHCGFCVDKNECNSRDNKCRGPTSSCVNTEGSYYCECRSPFVLGPCKERCYPERKAPELCVKPRTGILNQQGFSFRTYNEPIVIKNFRACAPGVTGGQDTTEKYDLDFNGKTDVRLSWHCVETEGRSNLKNYAEQEARWGPWTCWTACKATCWGGLQTRSRECRHGLPGQDGCAGEGSQKRSCYSGPRCKTRIRKSATKLSRAEIDDLMQAMKKYKEDDTAKGFHNAASAHGWPFQCNNESCCPHGARMKFITWHRSIVLNFEKGLSRYLKDPTLGIPYWDWLQRDPSPPNWALDRSFGHGGNPWTNMTILIDRMGSMRTIQRDDQVYMNPLESAQRGWNTVAAPKQKPHIMHEFSEALENAHGGPHLSVCAPFDESGGFREKCSLSLASLDYAAFDPLFMLHHCEVDRLWAVSQREMEYGRSTTWTTQTALEALEENADFGRRFEPFDNKDLSPFPIVRATNTMKDSYYYEELTGVKYDSLPKNGVSRAMQRALRVGGDSRLFVGQYFRHTHQTIHINYYITFNAADATPCSDMTESSRVGSTSRLGISRFARGYQLSVPHLTPMEKVGVNTGGLDSDFIIRACYTANMTCRERCAELSTPAILLQPDPSAVLYVRNQPVDIYKFVWAAGKRLPTWRIHMHAGSHWVYMQGPRRENVMQVSTASEYLACNARKGRAFNCGHPLDGNACMLPVGVYYLIDSDPAHCTAGLRMYILSKL